MYRAAGHFFGLQRNGDQRRLRHGGGKPDGRRKRIHEQVVVPPDAAFGCASRPGHRFGAYPGIDGGKLPRHGFADWKQRLLEADQKQGQPDQHVAEPGNDLAGVGQPAAQYRKLEEHQNTDNGSDIQRRGEHGSHQGLEKLHHQTAIPYKSTKIIGLRLAKAMSPKPSIIGLRPLMDLASPTPSAVTRGTVIVLVVTPPES